MSHRIIINSAVRAALQDPDVRVKLTPAQCARVDQILAAAEPCDEDFRYLTRRLNQAYCQDD